MPTQQEAETQLMAPTTEPGKWYLAVDCIKCGEAIPFAEVFSPADAPSVRYPTIVDLECLHCGHVGTYAAGAMSRRPG